MKITNIDLMLNCLVNIEGIRCIVSDLNRNYIMVNNCKNIYKEVDAIELNEELLSHLIGDVKPSEIYINGDLTEHYIDSNGFDVVKDVKTGVYSLINSTMEIQLKYLHELQIYTKNKYGCLNKMIDYEKRKYKLGQNYEVDNRDCFFDNRMSV